MTDVKNAPEILTKDIELSDELAVDLLSDALKIMEYFGRASSAVIECKTIVHTSKFTRIEIKVMNGFLTGFSRHLIDTKTNYFFDSVRVSRSGAIFDFVQRH